MSDKQPFDVVQVLFDKARLDQDLRRVKSVLTEAIDVLEAIPDRTIGTLYAEHQRAIKSVVKRAKALIEDPEREQPSP